MCAGGTLLCSLPAVFVGAWARYRLRLLVLRALRHPRLVLRGLRLCPQCLGTCRFDRDRYRCLYCVNGQLSGDAPAGHVSRAWMADTWD